MAEKATKAKQMFLIFGATISWFAIGIQFYLIIVNRTASVSETIIRFFSFYTILTNILVSLCLMVHWLKPNSRWGIYFSRPSVSTAIAINIFIVGLLYNLILRQMWSPEGLQRVADELLHIVIPLVFIVYWYLFAPKGGLGWKNAFTWLLYPLVYAIFVLFRGALSGFYPYPFIDINTLGYNQVILNSVGLFIGFFLISQLFIAITKAISRSSNNT
jgi:hypothetical protein